MRGLRRGASVAAVGAGGLLAGCVLVSGAGDFRESADGATGLADAGDVEVGNAGDSEGTGGEDPGEAGAETGPPPGYFARVMARQPLGYWRLDETGGTTAVDATKRVNGRYLGAVTTTPGPLASDPRSARLSTLGSGGVLVDGFPFPSSAAGFSVELWIQASDADDAVLLEQGDGASTGFALYLGDPARGTKHGAPCLRFNARELVCADSSTYADRQWHHVAVAWNGKAAAFFRDGAPDGTRAIADVVKTPVVAAPLALGARWTGTSNTSVDWRIPGSVAEVALFTSLLTPDDVKADVAAR